MVLYVIVWLLYGIVWLCIVVWCCMWLYGTVCGYMVLLGIVCSCMIMHGIVWFFLWYCIVCGCMMLYGVYYTWCVVVVWYMYVVVGYCVWLYDSDVIVWCCMVLYVVVW